MTAQGAARRRAAARNQDRTALSKPDRNGGGPTKAQPEKGARGGADAARQRNGGDDAGLDKGRPAHKVAPALWLQLLTLLIAVVGLADSIYITIQEETGSTLAALGY